MSSTTTRTCDYCGKPLAHGDKRPPEHIDRQFTLDIERAVLYCNRPADLHVPCLEKLLRKVLKIEEPK